MNKEQLSRSRFGFAFKAKLFTAAILLLIISLGFNALLTSLSLEKLYVESLVSSYKMIGKDMQRNLEYAVRYGKNIKKFIGMDNIMEEKLRYFRQSYERSAQIAGEKINPNNDFGRYIAVALPDGEIIYSTRKDLISQYLPKAAIVDFSMPKDEKRVALESHFIKHGGTYIVTLPIRDRKLNWIAVDVLAFDESQVKELIKDALMQSMKFLGIILSIGAFLIILLLYLIIPKKPKKEEYELVHFRDSDNKLQKKNVLKEKKFPMLSISVALFIIICVCQIVFNYFSANGFRDFYLRISKEKSTTLNMLLKDDIEYLLGKGLQINKLFKLEVVMGEILQALPEVSDISILDKNQRLMYLSSGEQGNFNFTKGAANEDAQRVMNSYKLTDDEYNLKIKILQNGQIAGFISNNISRKVMFSKLKEIILDAATVFVISILFFVELLTLIFHFIEIQVSQSDKTEPVRYGVIRPAAFLFFFGYNVCSSFLPLHIEVLYEPLWGLSKDMIMSLPISVAMFTAGISPFIAGTWLDRRGWHEPFFFGLLLASAGLFYSYWAPDAINFIVSRGLTGLGYGLAFIACNGFVIAHTDDSSKAQGITRLIAGCFAGYICGSSTGAMLADRIGYNMVFLIGSIIVISVILYALVFMGRAMKKPEKIVEDTTTVAAKKQYGFLHLLKFVFNRNVISLSLFNIIPTALVTTGFLYYFLPIYLTRAGITQSDVGRLLMIHGIFFIYVAPYISKYIDASKNVKNYIFINGLLGSIAFIIFYFLGGLIAAFASVLILGFAGSFDAANTYALKLKVTHDLGEGKAIAVLSLMERIGQVIGPILFGWLLISMGTKEMLSGLGACYLALSLFFLIFAQNTWKKSAAS